MATEPASPSDAGSAACPGPGPGCRRPRPRRSRNRTQQIPSGPQRMATEPASFWMRAPLLCLGLTRSPGAGKSSAGALCPGVAHMVAPVVRHETRALLRAHLAASTGYRHVTRHCAVCHRLQRLAMELAEPAHPDAGGTTINSSAPNLPPEADSDPH
ncbi:DUF6274 family protein [Streptomyces niveus]|uniref:DUF6274 family protein n=1 Tax=Streptomyces niveus TaxID=193462 RepID=UPI0035D7D4DA